MQLLVPSPWVLLPALLRLLPLQVPVVAVVETFAAAMVAETVVEVVSVVAAGEAVIEEVPGKLPELLAIPLLPMHLSDSTKFCAVMEEV